METSMHYLEKHFQLTTLNNTIKLTSTVIRPAGVILSSTAGGM